MKLPFLNKFDEVLRWIDHYENEPSFRDSESIAWLNNEFGDCITIILLKPCCVNGQVKFKLYRKIHNANPLSKKYLGILKQQELVPNCASSFDELIKEQSINTADVIKIHSECNKKSAEVIVFIKDSWNNIPSDQLFFYFLSRFLTEMERNFIQDFNAFVAVSKDSQVRNYIQTKQKTFIKLSFDLVKQFDRPDMNVKSIIKTQHTAQEFYALAYSTLESIIMFFERFYKDYIDYSEVLPIYYASKRFKSLAPKTTCLRSFFLKNIDDDELLKILYLPLLPATASSFDYKITYYELMYAESYINRFYDYCSKSKGENILIGVIKVLIELNYNNLDFMVWLTERMTNLLHQEENDTMRSKLLFSWLKSLNQTFTRIPKGYFPEQNSLKQRLNTWIDEELLYIKMTSEKVTETQISLGNMGLDKMQTNFSVAQLALFYRLQFEANIIESKSQKHLLDLVSQSIQTSKVHTISAKSLLNKYYDFDQANIEIVKHKIIEMLNILKDL